MEEKRKITILNINHKQTSILGPFKEIFKNKGIFYMLIVAFLFSIAGNYDKLIVLNSDIIFGSSLKSLIPSTISRAIKKMINDPAIPNDAASIPMKLSIFSPTTKNKSIIPPATIDAFPLLSVPPAAVLSFTTIGREPMISITANKTILAFAISMMSIVMCLNFCAKLYFNN